MVTNSSILSLIIKDTSNRIYMYFKWTAALLLVVSICTLFIHYIWKFRKSDIYIVLNTVGPSIIQAEMERASTNEKVATPPPLLSRRPPLHPNTPIARNVVFNLSNNKTKFYYAKRKVRKNKKKTKRTAEV
jgi:hypothetical protein